MSSLPPAQRASLSFPDPDEALLSMEFIEAAHPQIQALADSLGRGRLSEREIAVKAFAHVRDAVPYEFMAKLRSDQYRASYILEQGRGFCVQKAVLLAALLRACGIPSALVLGDLRDHTMPRHIVEAMGTDVMHGHGFTAVWMDEVWHLVDPSHDARFAARKGYELVSWHGMGDALIATTTRDGRQHAQFVGLQGVFLDLPFDALLGSFAAAYAKADIHALAMAGLPVEEMLAEGDASELVLALTGRSNRELT